MGSLRVRRALSVIGSKYSVLSTQYLAVRTCVGLAIVFGLFRAGNGEDTVQSSEPTFTEVRAILAAKCLACHGNDAKELKGDYDLRTREAAIKGGESGEAAIVPGQPEKSPLYRALTWQDESLQMPPKENDRLSAEQVAAVRRWIAAGAKWEEGSGVRSQESGVRGRRVPESGVRSQESGDRTGTARREECVFRRAAGFLPIGISGRMSRKRFGLISRCGG
jgi:mono/diheme cytochrome c family protein